MRFGEPSRVPRRADPSTMAWARTLFKRKMVRLKMNFMRHGASFQNVVHMRPFWIGVENCIGCGKLYRMGRIQRGNSVFP